VTERAGGAVRILAADAVARRNGVRPGMGLADARALLPALAVDEADPEADAALLAALADWADRYTPLVGLDPPDGLMLDVTGCAHLFGGEAALLDDALERLRSQGFAAAGAVADTPGAAHAVARFGGGGVVPPGAHGARIAGLPLAALRLTEDTVSALGRLGLKTVGMIADQPRAPLAARFGATLLRRLDQALGREGEAITPRLPAPALSAERRFADPLSLLDDVEAAVVSLAACLAAALERRGEGARMIGLALYRADGHVVRVSVGTARPLRDPRRMVRLLGERLATEAGGALDVGYGYDMVRLTVPLAAPLDPSQADLSGEIARAAEIDGLVDRLGARFGLAAVCRLMPLDTHVPERTTMAVPAATVAERALSHAAAPRPDAGEPPRFPVRLLTVPEPVETVAGVPDGPPQRFRWRRVLYDVVRAEGPERIGAEWWRADGPTRDYFRVEDAEGRRFWLYRDGLFGRETSAPRWYVHGLFG
jgi:protein ImuB